MPSTPPLLLQPLQHQSQHINAPAGRACYTWSPCRSWSCSSSSAVCRAARGRPGPPGRWRRSAPRGPGSSGPRRKIMPYLDTSTARLRIVGGHVAHDGHAPGFWHILPLSAVDGVVGAVVEIAGLRVQLQLILGGDVGVVFVLAGGGQVGSGRTSWPLCRRCWRSCR